MPIAEGQTFEFLDESHINSGFLEPFDFNSPGQLIITETDEFSAVCPFSGLPDYARLKIEYYPEGGKCMELKSLKYYIISFRNVGIYQEAATKRIYDDLIAVAEDMIDTGLTSPRHLGVYGGSNGGLLTGVMYTQRPDLWNAVVSAVPLLDMLRFDRLLAGASWVGEYGSPSNPDEGAFLQSISPYHNVDVNGDYPEIYLFTSTADDRVHPGHARKFAYLLSETGHPYLYYENMEGGHSAAANLPELARRDAMLYVFLTQKLMDAKVRAIAYETVENPDGSLPLLQPMSEVAGKMSAQVGASCLQKEHGGKGVLLGGVPGVKPANVLVIGGGVVGINAARMAMGLNARVTILDRSLDRLKYLDELYGDRMTTLYSTADAIEECLRYADLVVGAVLIPGAAAPKLVTRAQLALMKPGSVLVDVAIDQGGCFETSKATTHQNPTYDVDGIVHYCVANMPGGVARTSTFALTNATLPFAVQLANKGAKRAMLDDVHLLNGLNVHAGQITYEAVARDLGYSYVPAAKALG